MAKSQKKQGLPGKHSTAAERVVWLLDHVWEGNRNAMAAAVEVSHSVLVKIALGQQNPGRRLLTAIAAHPKVNPAWLYTGEGEPLLASAQDETTEGWPVRVAEQLLPGPLNQHRAMLSKDSFRVAGEFYRDTRYWLRVRPTDPVAKARFTGILPNDLLLIETDNTKWTIPSYLENRFCVIRAGNSLELRRVHWFPADPASRAAEHLRAEVDNFANEPRRLRITIDVPLTGKPKMAVQRRTRVLASPAVQDAEEDEFGPKIAVKDVVGVCMLLVRDF